MTRLREIQERAETPPTGFFHVAKENLHGRSAREVDPPFETFDVVLRRDWDGMVAHVASLESALERIVEMAEGRRSRVAIAAVARNASAAVSVPEAAKEEAT